MKHNTDTLWTMLTGGGVASIAFLLGGFDKLILALVILMIIDYITGLMAAYQSDDVGSKKGMKGIFKKAGMLMAVIVAVQFDLITGSGDFMRNTMILFMIGNEGISFIENLGRMGVKIPKILSDSFAQLKDTHVDKSTKQVVEVKTVIETKEKEGDQID